MSPSVSNTPQGRAKIIEFGVARAHRDQEIASLARKWTQKAGRIDKPDRNGRTFFDHLNDYADSHPLMAGK